jgi:hypothetical protein
MKFTPSKAEKFHHEMKIPGVVVQNSAPVVLFSRPHMSASVVG